MMMRNAVVVCLLEALVEVLMDAIAKSAHLYTKVSHHAADLIHEAPLHVPMLMNKRVLVQGMDLQLVFYAPFYCF